MTWPVQPIGTHPPGPSPIAPVDRSQGTERRRGRGRDEDEQQKKRRQREDAPEGQGGPDADGHIDVLA